MANTNQNSIISYVPQPYFIGASCTLVGFNNIAAIENEPGIFDPDLSDYTTIEPTQGVADFAVQIDFSKQSGHLGSSDMSLGFIGCSLLTYEDDGGSPDLASEFSENINCHMSADITAVVAEQISYAHNSEDTVHTFCQAPMPSIISGGQSNIMFNGLGVSTGAATATVFMKIVRTAADVAARPHAVLQVGHLFIGIDVPVVIDPRSFAWTLDSQRERFVARDFGAINADGTLVKRATGEVLKIDNYSLIGTEITDVSGDVVATRKPNFFDLIKANTSYPLLLNPYPVPLVEVSSYTVDQLNLTARQNFYSIYGFFEDPLETQVGEYRDGLDSEYRARFRIRETR
jgi:hypothetical protein